MSLKDFVIQTKTIKMRAGELTLNGLTFNELTALLLNDEEGVHQAYTLYEKYSRQDGSIDMANLKAFGMDLVKKFPDFVARLIALSCGELDQWPKAARLPAPAQLEALIAVAQLTFEEPSAVKKFIEQLIEAMEATTMAMEALKNSTAMIVPGSDSTKGAEGP